MKCSILRKLKKNMCLFNGAKLENVLNVEVVLATLVRVLIKYKIGQLMIFF